MHEQKARKEYIKAEWKLVGNRLSDYLVFVRKINYQRWEGSMLKSWIVHESFETI